MPIILKARPVTGGDSFPILPTDCCQHARIRRAAFGPTSAYVDLGGGPHARSPVTAGVTDRRSPDARRLPGGHDRGQPTITSWKTRATTRVPAQRRAGGCAREGEGAPEHQQLSPAELSPPPQEQSDSGEHHTPATAGRRRAGHAAARHDHHEQGNEGGAVDEVSRSRPSTRRTYEEDQRITRRDRLDAAGPSPGRHSTSPRPEPNATRGGGPLRAGVRRGLRRHRTSAEPVRLRDCE